MLCKKKLQYSYYKISTKHFNCIGNNGYFNGTRLVFLSIDGVEYIGIACRWVELDGPTFQYQIWLNCLVGYTWNILYEIPSRLQRIYEFAFQFGKMLTVLIKRDVNLVRLN